MKKTRSLIGAVIAVLLTVFLLNPKWLPFSGETKNAIMELEKTHFLIQRSGHITLAHILALLLALCVVWLCYLLLKLILNLIGRRDDHTRTVTGLIAGVLFLLWVLVSLAN